MRELDKDKLIRANKIEAKSEAVNEIKEKLEIKNNILIHSGGYGR